MVTGIYAAVFAVMQIWMSLQIVKVRRAQHISLGDGGNDELLRKTRAHGNFTETVPMALILMGIAEFSGSPLWVIHVLGLTMVIGRCFHYRALTSGSSHGRYRVYGMMATFWMYIVAALLCVWLALPSLGIHIPLG